MKTTSDELMSLFEEREGEKEKRSFTISSNFDAQLFAKKKKKMKN